MYHPPAVPTESTLPESPPSSSSNVDEPTNSSPALNTILRLLSPTDKLAALLPRFPVTSQFQKRTKPSTKFNHYETAYKKFEHKNHRHALQLARAARQSATLEQQLAAQRVKEGELSLEILRSNAQQAQLRLEEANLHVGVVRAFLHANRIPEDADCEDEEVNGGENLLAVPNENSDTESVEDNAYFEMSASIQPLTESALHRLNRNNEDT